METIKFGHFAVSDRDAGIAFRINYGETADIETSDIPVLIDFLKKHLNESANRRSSWRLPLSSLRDTEADQLRITILSGEVEQVVTPIDISLTGMFIHAPLPVGETGEHIDLEIEFGGSRVELRGLIVRQDKSMTRCGLQFVGCMDSEGTPCPPTELSEIFYQLEQVWLDKKLALEWR
ncbi:PilZ domain-containing protein [Parahaliea aestuarii]|uniref:PilZ domain-containing protein n=1 Tax=Parahaliea aestuarii TaxID=1852021 RepID=A0A5C9A0A3_9GAMM|nr:PilZ domain-containing protein [Parahaliea aestuarii]TXS93489.1 PilZ domain-containing protein [Parahaliea aestuarii]